jgi:glycosyltransferase involved in cell wall biosynthesis
MAWIESCLQSLLTQDFDRDRYEIIAVDNNSSDDSARLIRRHERVRLLQEPEQSSYAARNRGVRESSGEVLAFTDADCIPDRNWLSVIDSTMRNQKTQAMLGPCVFDSPSRVLLHIADYENARIEYILTNQRQSCYFAYTNNMAVRRTAFDRYGSFPVVKRGGDTLFLQEMTRGEGPQAVEWSSGMLIRHLELSGAGDYLRKNFIYARARHQTKHIGQCEVLTLRESFDIFRAVCRGRSSRDTMALALLLSTGRLAWAAGSLL